MTDDAQLIVQDAGRRIEEMAKHYRLTEGVPERITEKLEKALSAQTIEEARSLAEKAVGSMQIHALAEWGSGRSPGPLTAENLEKHAAKRESLANFVKAKGNEESAEKNRKAAEELRRQAEEIRRG